MKNVQKYQLCCSPLMSTLFIVLACHWCLQKIFFEWGAFSLIVPSYFSKAAKISHYFKSDVFLLRPKSHSSIGLLLEQNL